MDDEPKKLKNMNKPELVALLEEFSEKIEKAKNNFNYISNATEKINTLEGEYSQAKTSIGTTKDEIKGIKNDIEDLLRDIEADKEAVQGFYEKVFAKEVGIKVTLEEFQNTFSNYRDEWKTFSERAEKSYSDKDKKIEDLLGPATAAALARGYRDSKQKYGFATNSLTLGNWKSWIIPFLSSVSSSLFNYVLFIAPLCIIIYLFRGITLNDFNHENSYDFFVRLTLTIPLGVISLFGHSSIRLNRRLYEEYNHKQRVMELYNGFKEEISELEHKELQESLLYLLLKTVDHKPTLVMQSYDKDFLEKLTTFFNKLILSKISKRSELQE